MRGVGEEVYRNGHYRYKWSAFYTERWSSAETGREGEGEGEGGREGKGRGRGEGGREGEGGGGEGRGRGRGEEGGKEREL